MEEECGGCFKDCDEAVSPATVDDEPFAWLGLVEFFNRVQDVPVPWHLEAIEQIMRHGNAQDDIVCGEEEAVDIARPGEIGNGGKDVRGAGSRVDAKNSVGGSRS